MVDPDEKPAVEPKPKAAPAGSVKLASVHLENRLVVPVADGEEVVIDHDGTDVPAKHLDHVKDAAWRSGFPLREVEKS
jgi:hypothetical protein